jgi:hypothetical protein
MGQFSAQTAASFDVIGGYIDITPEEVLNALHFAGC